MSRNGRACKNAESTKPKMAALAPIPSAMVRTAAVVKPGDLRNTRTPKRKSWTRLSIRFTAHASRHSSFARSMPPNSMRARRRASSRGTPLRTKSSANASMWNRNSASISLSIRERRSKARIQDTNRLHAFILPPPWPARFLEGQCSNRSGESPRSFVPQRHNGIHAHRPPRGDVSSKHRHHGHGYRYDEVDSWIEDVQPAEVEHSLQQFRQGERHQEPNSCSNRGHS